RQSSHHAAGSTSARPRRTPSHWSRPRAWSLSGVPMKSRLLPALLLGIATVSFGPIACSNGDEQAAEQDAGAESGILLEAMDTSVDPGDDFYAYANGGW